MNTNKLITTILISLALPLLGAQAQTTETTPKSESKQVVYVSESDLEAYLLGAEIDLLIVEGEKEETVSIKMEQDETPCPTFKVKITNLEELEISELAAKTENGINELNNSELNLQKLSLSPNPSNGRFDLAFSLEKTEAVVVQFLSLDGKQVYGETLNDFNGQYRNSIDISDQPAGVYVLQVIQGEQFNSKKIVITD